MNMSHGLKYSGGVSAEVMTMSGMSSPHASFGGAGAEGTTTAPPHACVAEWNEEHPLPSGRPWCDGDGVYTPPRCLAAGQKQQPEG